MTWDRPRDRRPQQSRLYRDPKNGIILGVCAGIADYFGVERWVVRAVTLVSLLIFTLMTIVAYFLAGVLLPKVPEPLYESSDQQRFWREVRTEPSQSFSALRHRFREMEHRLQTMEALITSREFRLNQEINDLDA